MLVLSTPDREVYSAPGQPVNRFHVLELTCPEFAALLNGFFAHHRILRQRPLLGSVMAPVEPIGGGWRSYDRRAPDMLEAMPGLSQASCLIALASDYAHRGPVSSIYSDTASVDEAINAAARCRGQGSGRTGAGGQGSRPVRAANR